MFCTHLILTSSIQVSTITPFPEGISGSFGNAFYFVILLSLGATIMYLLLKKKNQKLIILLTGFALSIAVLLLSFIYLSAAILPFSIPYRTVLTTLLSFLMMGVADYAIFRARRQIADAVILLLGGALGSFLGVTIPTLSAFSILICLAAYDIFAVYYGPVGKIANIGLDQIRGLSFSFRNFQMGLGDLTFYSMLSGHMLLNFGLISSLASIFGILVGCLLVFQMLEKKTIFPGLPFPIFLGLTTSFLLSRLCL
jgi:presenilin-like A22 family membrane protease